MKDQPLKDRPRSGRPQVIKREMVRKAFEDDLALKMTKLAKRKKISVATVSRAVKSEGGKFEALEETSVKCCNASEASRAMWPSSE